MKLWIPLVKFTFVYHDEEHSYSLYFVCDPWHNGVEVINKSLSGVGVHKICSD